MQNITDDHQATRPTLTGAQSLLAQPKKQLPRLLTIALLTLALCGAFAAGTFTGYQARSVQAAAEEPAQFSVFWEAWQIVNDHFVERNQIDFTRMTYGAIQGMLDSLGDQNHTAFLSPEVARQEASSMEGSFEGIGAYIDGQNDQFRVIAPIHGSPAEAAGILAGDIVLKVDGTDVTGMAEWDVIQRVRGPAGSEVVLNVIHPGEKTPVDIKIVRAEIDIESVIWSRIPDTTVAYIQITQFASDTGDELKKALEAITAENAQGEPVTGILLDLRNNPGGLLNEAIRAGSQFLPEGAIILNERDAEGRVSTLKSVGEGMGRELPIVVLVNEGSASAAEILAGALQDNGRGKVVGMKTVGTGTVLIPFTLSDGSVIRLGVSNWLTPKLKLIKNQGIQPDVQIQQAPDVEKVDAYKLREAETRKDYPQGDHQFNSALILLQLKKPAQS